MLISFSFENLFSFKDKVDFSMSAYNKLTTHHETLIPFKDINILKSVAIFGPNSSGKTNFCEAFRIFRNSVRSFDKDEDATSTSNLPDKISPFLLSTTTEDKPTKFSIDFTLDKEKVFNYKIEIRKQEVLYESLSEIRSSSEKKYFERKNKEIYKLDLKLFPEGDKIKKLKVLNSRNSLLAVSLFLNGELSKKIIKEFEKIRFFTQSPFPTPLLKDKDEALVSNILNMMKFADIGINNIQYKKTKKNEDSFLSFLSRNKVSFEYLKYNEHHEVVSKPVSFTFDKQSLGTQKYFNLTCTILTAIKKGHLLIIDEIEASLHPLMIKELIQLFNSKENSKGAQLIFNTHNTNLLNSELLRSDQVWFVDKNRYGESSIFSLLDFGKESRIDANWEKRYLNGLYGAIPNINITSFKDVLKEIKD